MKCLVLGKYVDGNIEEFRNACDKIGKYLLNNNHSLIMCSPFEDSADYWVLKGYGNSTHKNSVEIYYIDTKIVCEEIEKLKKIVCSRLIKIPHIDVDRQESQSKTYSWLLCQLQALENCDYIITIGGNESGALKMLLLIAESKRIPIIPFPYFGGESKNFYNRNYYELSDKLGDEFLKLDQNVEILNSDSIKCLFIDKLRTKRNVSKAREKTKFFISYSRERPNEADFVENVLRRRNLNVFRDDTNFGAGSNIPNEIKENIYSADIFISMWCSSYACSPWCYDELEMALDRMEDGQFQLWIFCIDETRIVPKRARNLLHYRLKNRKEIEGELLKLLSELEE